MGSGRSSGRLRGELTEFVGRRAELALVRRSLGAGRLVTLTGPGGIGKSRLALEAASDLRRAFHDGVWLVELGELGDPALLVPEVARSLGLSDRSARWAVASLADYLADRQLLLILDGCEQLADACAVMADALLRACPGLRVVATSRHVLGVAGEVTIAVPPMTVPAEAGPATPEELLCFEAARLFADRASAVVPGFTLDASNGQTVAGVCRALDGIPLAIELAAVRLRSLSPAQLLSRLDSRLQLLSSGGPASQPHHRTLRATIDWSYGLMAGPEQTLWRRVSVFAGSFDLDAAEAVCAGGGLVAGEIADLIDTLVAKSMLSVDVTGPQARYGLLDTLGEFGLQKLRADEGEHEFRARHRDWYAALAARQEAFGPGRAGWIAALDTDHGNLRAALQFCLADPQEVPAGAELACDLWRYWETHGHITEGRRILAALLDKLEETAAVRARGLWVAGFLALVQGDLPAARSLLEAGLAAAEEAGDVRSVAYASSQLGYVRYFLGDAGRGRALAERSLLLARQSADPIGVVLALTQIGFMHLCSGEAHMAAERFGECARLAGDDGNVWYQGYARWGLAVARWLLGDHDETAALACQSLRSMRDIDDPIGIAECLDVLAWVAASKNNPARAAALLGAAEAAWTAIPAMLQPALSDHHKAAVRRALEGMPLGAYTAKFDKGAAMNPGEAIAFALGELARPALPSAIHRPGNEPQLTHREQDVAALVAQGLSNSQIAARLVISVRTVESHVRHIMDKLGVSTRGQIAVWSAAQPPAP